MSKPEGPKLLTPAYDNQVKRIQYTPDQLNEIGKNCTGLPCPAGIPLILRTNVVPDPTLELENEKGKYAPR